MQPLITKPMPTPEEQNHRSSAPQDVAELLSVAATAEGMPVEWVIDYAQSGEGRII
jgi:hypothetical protein